MFEPTIKNLFNLDNTRAKDLFERYKYPWELLSEISKYILVLSKTLPSSYKEIAPQVWVDEGTTIEKTALINGPAIIGKDCEIRHCTFIRGNVIIGDNCVVGNSTEVKNSILFNNVQIPHFNYVGDSILGYKSHLGAGVILSNVKSAGGNVSVNVKGEKLQTNIRKIGGIIGDYVEIGCNSVINPGTIIGPGTQVYPLTFVRGTIDSNCILKNNNQIVQKNK